MSVEHNYYKAPKSNVLSSLNIRFGWVMIYTAYVTALAFSTSNHL